VLVPFVRDLVPTVDLHRRLVVVVHRPGLVDDGLREVRDAEDGIADAH
jgi:hypothetical protein